MYLGAEWSSFLFLSLPSKQFGILINLEHVIKQKCPINRQEYTLITMEGANGAAVPDSNVGMRKARWENFGKEILGVEFVFGENVVCGRMYLETFVLKNVFRKCFWKIVFGKVCLEMNV